MNSFLRGQQVLRGRKDCFCRCPQEAYARKRLVGWNPRSQPDLDWADKQQSTFGIMKPRCSNLVRFLSVLSLATWAVAPRASSQTPPVLDIHLYAGLTITGAVGTVYSIEYVTDLAQTNNPSAWRCLEYLQLPASPYLWADKSAPAIGRRFYRAVVFPAPTNMVFIPRGRSGWAARPTKWTGRTGRDRRRR